jgi:hypothetical protein
LLELSKDVLRKWVVKVVRYDEGAGRKTKRSRSSNGLDRADLRDRAIVFGDYKRFAPEYPLENSFGISLHLFNTDVHGQRV